MIANEWGALCSTLLRIFQAAFPFEHSPPLVAVLRELAEYGFEVDLPVTERTKTTRAVFPCLKATVDPLPPGWPELGVLDVEGLDPVMVDVDVAQIIELLQHEMAGVVQEVRSRMLAHTIEEHLEAGAVAEVFPGVDLVADVNAALKSAADGALKGILEYSTAELVSIDFKGNPHSSIVDAPYTKVMDGDFVKVVSWYDNEWGYSNRCVDLLRLLVKRGI